MPRNRNIIRKRKQREEKKCLNCDTELTGRYCHNCGQENVEQKEPIGRVFLNLIEGLTFFNSKFFKTLIPFIVKPGLLTKEYNNGKRASFLSPIKMYFFLSFLYFLLYFTFGTNLGNTVDITIGKDVVTDSSKISKQQKDSIYNKIAEARSKEYSNWFSSKIRKLEMEAIEKDDNSTLEIMNRSFLSNIPKVVFFVMPFFALVLKLFYRKNYYIEHLVHSLHIHSFAFLVLILSLSLKITIGIKGGGMGVISTLITIIYFTISLYKVHHQKISKVLVKSFLSVFLYAILFILGFAANIFISVALI